MPKFPKDPAPGWVGGFAQSNPEFMQNPADLTSLKVQDNMDNIEELDRQMKVLWPEFSWLSRPANDASRCYCKFATDISRLGYTNEGRVYSIICPQQGVWTEDFGVLNIEVTVTGNRGWVDETAKGFAADMGVMAQIWFSETSYMLPKVRALETYMRLKNIDGYTFPFGKKNALKIKTHKPGNPSEPLFRLETGQNKGYTPPPFAVHDKAWMVGNLAVEIGDIVRTGNADVDEFNQLFLNLFNAASGNMLAANSTLTWNVWMQAPTIVDQKEWTDHAWKWRLSLQTNTHPLRYGDGPVRYTDGTLMDTSVDFALDIALAEAALLRFIRGYVEENKPIKPSKL